MSLTHEEFLQLLDARPNHETDPDGAKAWWESVSKAEREIRQEILQASGYLEEKKPAEVELAVALEPTLSLPSSLSSESAPLRTAKKKGSPT